MLSSPGIGPMLNQLSTHFGGDKTMKIKSKTKTMKIKSKLKAGGLTSINHNVLIRLATNDQRLASTTREGSPRKGRA
jgi:hypothetical protein